MATLAQAHAERIVEPLLGYLACISGQAAEDIADLSPSLAVTAYTEIMCVILFVLNRGIYDALEDQNSDASRAIREHIDAARRARHKRGEQSAVAVAAGK